LREGRKRRDLFGGKREKKREAFIFRAKGKGGGWFCLIAIKERGGGKNQKEKKTKKKGGGVVRNLPERRKRKKQWKEKEGTGVELGCANSRRSPWGGGKKRKGRGPPRYREKNRVEGRKRRKI